jgi:hypothetical protein
MPLGEREEDRTLDLKVNDSARGTGDGTPCGARAADCYMSPYATGGGSLPGVAS